MKKEIAIFSNPEFGTVRTIAEEENMLFCGKDIAAALGYSNTKDAIIRHCRGVVKRDLGVKTGQRANGTDATQIVEAAFIPEGDVYRLICNSKLPTAEKFERWVFDEILPSIRKHGAYMTPQKLEEALLNPDVLIRLATELKLEQEKTRSLANKVEEMKPKELFADAVSCAQTDILIGDLAKLLKQNGLEIGQKRLFERLRADGFLIKQNSSSYNMPTQRAMEKRLFRVKETDVVHSDGHITISKTVKVTGVGQIFFVNYFLGNISYLPSQLERERRIA